MPQFLQAAAATTPAAHQRSVASFPLLRAASLPEVDQCRGARRDRELEDTLSLRPENLGAISPGEDLRQLELALEANRRHPVAIWRVDRQLTIRRRCASC